MPHTKVTHSHCVIVCSEYKYAEAKGKRAVDAISNYVSVAQTLNQSTLIAQAANKTLTTALKGLSAIGVRDLENQANISRKSSEDLLKAVTAYNLDGPGEWVKLLEPGTKPRPVRPTCLLDRKFPENLFFGWAKIFVKSFQF